MLVKLKGVNPEVRRLTKEAKKWVASKEGKDATHEICRRAYLRSLNTWSAY